MQFGDHAIQIAQDAQSSDPGQACCKFKGPA